MLDFGAIPPEINSGLMYTGPGSGPIDGRRRRLGWGGGGAGHRGIWLQFGDLGVDQCAVDRAFIVGDAFGGHPVRVLAERAGRAGRGDRRPGHRRCRGLRDRIRDDGAPAGDRGQPSAVGQLDRDELPGPEHAGDRGHRSPVHGDVGPRRRRDVRLCRLLGRRLGVVPVRDTAEHHHTRCRDQPGPRGHPSRRTAGGQLRTNRGEHAAHSCSPSRPHPRQPHKRQPPPTRRGGRAGSRSPPRPTRWG